MTGRTCPRRRVPTSAQVGRSDLADQREGVEMSKFTQVLGFALAFVAYVTVKTVYIIPPNAPDILVQSL
jgi:hypothetical protein